MSVNDESPKAVAVDELFDLLGNQLRMEIMQVLWDAFIIEHHMVDESDPLQFSVIFEQTSSDDSGNFNYHIGQLTGTLIEQRDGGYILTPLGYNVMRAIESYANITFRTIDDTPIGSSCPFCDAELVATYNREILRVRCTNCGGLGGDGNINYVQIPATSAPELDLRTMLDIAALELTNRVTYASSGICPECYTELVRTVQFCEDHTLEAYGTCNICDLRFGNQLQVDCSGCGWGGVGPLLEYALIDPRVRRQYEHELSEDTPARRPWDFRIDTLGLVEESISWEPRQTCRYHFAFDDPVEVAFEVEDDRLSSVH